MFKEENHYISMEGGSEYLYRKEKSKTDFFFMYLFQFLANEVEGLKDGIRRAGNGNDTFRTGSIRNVDAGTRLIKCNSFFIFHSFTFLI